MKSQRFDIRGMAKDLTRGKATQNYAYDMMNLRSVPVDDGTMFCLVNEKGNQQIVLYEEDFEFQTNNSPSSYNPNVWQIGDTSKNTTSVVATLKGILLGYCITTNYLVVFSHQEGIGISEPDHIYRIRKGDDGTYYCLTVYDGNLGFDAKNPIETQSWYESGDMEKVYWIDGKNQLRSVNVGQGGVVIQGLDTQFDTLPTLQLNETVDITQTVEGGGIFPPGVLQYVFTYIGWNGQESNIFHHTPLYYLMDKDGGLPPQDGTTSTRVCKNKFEIGITNPDGNFRFVRVYSLIRTGEDTPPQCRQVADLEIVSSPLTYTDTYRYGSLVEYSTILLKNDVEIIPQTMAQKDNVLFLANYKRENISETEVPSNGISQDTFLAPDLDYSDGCMTYNHSESGGDNSPYNSFGGFDIDGVHEAYKHFKKGNTYRLGYQLQDKFGHWGDVTFIEDYIPNDDASTLLCTLDFSGIDCSDYRKVRPVIVYPNETERYFECQGELNSTLINPQLKRMGIDVIPSWFSRPSNVIDSVNYDNYGDPDYIESVALEGIKGLWHERPADDRVIFCMGAEICKANSTSYGSRSMYKSNDVDDTDFFVNEQVLDLYSPDIEFESGKTLFGRTLELGYVSKERFSSNYYLKAKGTFDNPADNGQYTGFYYEKRDDSTLLNNEGVTYSGPFWFDSVYMSTRSPKLTQHNSNNNFDNFDSSVAELYQVLTSHRTKDFLSIEGGHVITPWHKPFANGNRFNDIGGALNASEDSGLITTKTLVNVKQFNDFQFIRDGQDPIMVNLDDAQTYHKENGGSLLHLNNACNNSIYQGMVDFNMVIENHEVVTRAVHRANVDSVYTRVSTQSFISLSNLTYFIPYDFNGGDFDAVNNFADIATIYSLQPEDTFYGLELVSDFVYQYDDDHQSFNHMLDYKDYFDGMGNNGPDSGTLYTYLRSYNNWNVKFCENLIGNWYNNYVDHIICTPYVVFVEQFWNANVKVEHVPININFCSNTHGVLSLAGKQGNDSTEHYYSLWTKFYYYDPSNSVDHPWFTNNEFKRICSNQLQAGQLYFANLINMNNTSVDFGGCNAMRYYEQDWYVAGPAIDVVQTGSPTVRLLWLEGDVYYQRYDALRTYAASEDAIESIIDIDSYPVQTYVNIDGRYDWNRESDTNFYLSPTNFNLINKAYSSKNDFFVYHGKNPQEISGTQGNVVTWTLPKKTEELVDTWLDFDLLATLLLDGNKGAITALRRYDNDIYAFQEHAISRIRFNVNTLINTNNDMPLEVKNSNAVEGKDYLTQTIGCQDKWTICEGAKGIYFIDGSQREIHLMGGEGISNISDALLMSSWCNEKMKGMKAWNPRDFDGMVTLHDNIDDEIMFVRKDDALALYEGPATQQSFFEGFFSYGSMPFMAGFMGDIIQVHVDIYANTFTLWKRHEGDYNSFFGTQQDYWLTFIANGMDGNNGSELGTDKNFEYVEYRADKFSFEKDSEDWTQCEHDIPPFTWMQAKNEHQTANQSLSFNPFLGGNTTKKFRIWRTLFPRPTQGYGEMQQRIRNPWCSITLKNETNWNDNYKNVINDMVVYYN